jgi:hypothetical protein
LKTSGQGESAADRIAKRLPPPRAASILKCSPQFVGPGDVVHVEDIEPPSDSAAIILPGGRADVLTVPDWVYDTDPPLNSTFLKRSNKLDIPVSQVSRGVVEDLPEYTFKETGFYRIVLGISADAAPDDFPDYGVNSYCDVYYDAAQRVLGKNTRMPKPAGWNWVLDDPEEK